MANRSPERARAAASGGAAAWLAVHWLVGCTPVEPTAPVEPPPAHVRPTPSGPPVAFSWVSVWGGEASSEALRGRTTVLAFITTYDVASQAEARFVHAVARRHTPRINAALVVLERAENRPLIEAFASALEPPFPVAIADAATIRGEGPFQGLHHVPSIVVLDASGRERARHLGLIDEAGLEALVRQVEAAR